jgi:hypothetical protein
MVIDTGEAMPAQIPQLSALHVSPIVTRVGSAPVRELIDTQDCDCTNLLCAQPLERCGQLWPPTLDSVGQSWAFAPILAGAAFLETGATEHEPQPPE